MHKKQNKNCAEQPEQAQPIIAIHSGSFVITSFFRGKKKQGKIVEQTLFQLHYFQPKIISEKLQNANIILAK